MPKAMVRGDFEAAPGNVRSRARTRGARRRRHPGRRIGRTRCCATAVFFVRGDSHRRCQSR